MNVTFINNYHYSLFNAVSLPKEFYFCHIKHKRKGIEMKYSIIHRGEKNGVDIANYGSD
jgi:hypothetical protein